MDSDYQTFYIIISSAKIKMLIVTWGHTIPFKRLQHSSFDVPALQAHFFKKSPFGDC